MTIKRSELRARLSRGESISPEELAASSQSGVVDDVTGSRWNVTATDWSRTPSPIWTAGLGRSAGRGGGAARSSPAAVLASSRNGDGAAACPGLRVGGGAFADLYDAANPKTGPDKALVAAYWHQVVQTQPDFGGQEVNNSLKHLGHAVSNITAALTALMNRKPRLVIQTHKAGKAVQARKRYKVTREGIRAVEAMIKPGSKGSS